MALHVRIGELVLDEARREVRRDGREVPVQPKVFDVLVHLVRARHRVVSRDELLRAVWPDVAVEADSVTRAIAEVRRLLGDDARGQQQVRTHPRRGFRFVGAVVELAPTSVDASLPDIIAELERVLRLARALLHEPADRAERAEPGLLDPR